MKQKLRIVLGCLLFISTSIFSQTTITDSITSNGLIRTFKLYIPKNYDAGKAYPLVFNLHGYGSSASEQQLYSNFMPIADTAQFLTVYPQGTLFNGDSYWNITLEPLGANDVLFISDLINHMALKYKIDLTSVYSCGMSMGGFMSYTLACVLNHRIAAIASVTGTILRKYFPSCSPTRSVPTLQIHGTGDNTVPYNGNATMMGIDTVVDFWVKNNKCITPAKFQKIPDVNTKDGSTVEHYEYEAKQLGNATCELYKVLNGGHTWPGSPFLIPNVITNGDFNASNKIWLFFRKYKLSTANGITKTKDSEVTATIYPNPCIDEVTIEGKNIQQIIIVDIAGRKVMETTEKQLTVSHLTKGVYSVRIKYKNNNHEVKKLVKL